MDTRINFREQKIKTLSEEKYLIKIIKKKDDHLGIPSFSEN